MSKLSASKPPYRITISRAARKQLLQLPTKAKAAVATAIDELAIDPRPNGVKKLEGQAGYRIRVGDYRILYLIFDEALVVELVKLGQRGNFYDD